MHTIKRLLLYSLPLAALVLLGAAQLPGLSSPKASDPTAEQVLQRHVQAIGGAQAFAKLHTRRSQGTILYTSLDTLSLLSIFETKTAMRRWQSRSEGLGELLEGSDAQGAWSSSLMEGSRLLQGIELGRTLHEAPLDSDLHWEAYFATRVYQGTASIDGTDCHVLQLTPEGGRLETRYYAQESGLLLRVETIRELYGSPAPANLSYADYRWVDGVQLPHALHEEYKDIEDLYIKLESIEHNQPMPAALFSAPEEVRELRQQG